MLSDKENNSCPASVVKIFERCKNFDTFGSRKAGFSFKPGPTDVIISTVAKAGTTLTQQICHGLRSCGNMNFEEIGLVIPCLEMATDYGYGNLYKKQPFQPQMFKTHFPCDRTPKGAGKYITVVRRPSDVAVSFYHFFANWMFDKNEVTMEEFVEWFWLKRSKPISLMDEASVFYHTMSWYPYRHHSNVLWLHYEDLEKDLRGCVKIIAEFLDIGADDAELQELVTKQASIEFMKKHSTKFDEHSLKLARNEAAGLSKHAGLVNNPGKVRNGRSGDGKECIPKRLLERIDKKWNETFTSVTGYKTYDDLRYGVNKELNRKFS